MNSRNNRYIPSSESNYLQTQLQLSRIESKRGYLNSRDYNNIPSNDSPFHPVIFQDVQYAEPSLSKTNRCLTKYENKYPNTTDIALYDTRNHDLNATDIPGLENNVLYKQQLESARNKIQQAHTDLYSAYGDFNGTEYNPFLPISETNKPPSSSQQNQYPILTDERMQYHTNERPWNYESDRANIAYDLQRSPEIIERNRRQQESDDAFLHRVKKNRWVEPKMAYMDRQYDPHYSIDEYTKKQIDKNNADRITTLSPIRTTEAFVQSRNGFDETDMNHLNAEIYGNFQPEYSRDMKAAYDANNLKSRIEQFYPNDTFADILSKVKGSFTNASSYISDTITSFFGWNSNGNKYQSSSSSLQQNKDSHLTYDSDGSITYNSEKYNVPLHAEVNTLPFERNQESGTERFFYKPDHVLLVKNGEIPDVFPDENRDYTAVSFVQGDPLNTGLIRTIVLKDDSKYKIIQKRAEDAIFSGDNRPYGEDFVTIEIPINMIDEKIRDRIKKNNMDTKRDKVLELTYDDFVAFSDFIVEHPEVQQRLSFSDLHQRVRTNKYDSDIISNFEGRKTFVDEKVYAVIENNIRMKQMKQNTGRVDKDQSSFTQHNDPLFIQTQSPLHSSLSPSSSSMAYRTVQLNDTQINTKRSGKLQLNRFNV